MATAGTDVLALAAAMLLAYVFRFGPHGIAGELLLIMVVAPVLMLAVFSSFRLYSIEQLSAADEFRRVGAAVAVGMTVITVASFWSKGSYSRLWVALTWVLATVFILASRKAWRLVIRRMRADGRLAYRTLIVGRNGEVARLARIMSARHLGFRPIAYIATGDRAEDGPYTQGLPMIGHVSTVREAIRDTAADCVFVASTSVSESEMATVTKAARREGVEVRVSANLPQILSTRPTLQPFGDVMALSLAPVRLTGRQAALKRAFDLAVASVALVLTLPILAAAALAVRVTSHGHVLFRQERVGRHGKTFTLLKLRTMVAEAEDMILDLTDRNEASRPLFKIKDDPRVTRLGRFLRRWSIDELPQLFNVIRGDMSLVGPRPALPAEVAQYDDWHRDRLEVRPGITGLWQVNGRSDATFDAYVRMDLFYIENWSISYDIFILSKTLPAVLSLRGSY